MDIEFHYYMTYLVSASAGFSIEDAKKIAYSSQYVDDNDIICEIDEDKPTCYTNYISQTMNILKPKAKLFRIYPLFHFIPGDPRAETAWRKDGKMHWLNTTPNSINANAVLDAALKSNNMYRIGIAIHSYVDTWAHQNFIGYYDDFNSMSTYLGYITPNIGHADAGTDPDAPALIWSDPRLIKDRVNNKERFLEAAECLYGKLTTYTGINNGKVNIVKDLSEAIGKATKKSRGSKNRIKRYLKLALKKKYGGAELEKYDPAIWFDKAVCKTKHKSRLFNYGKSDYTHNWADTRVNKSTDWYRFQEAVKEHQECTFKILENSNMKGLKLESL